MDAADALNSSAEIRDHFVAAFTRLPDLERILARIHGGRCKVKDFVRALEGFQVILEGIERINEKTEMNQEFHQGLLGKLLGTFDGVKTMLDGWKHAFDWDKAKEEGFGLHIRH